MPRIPTLTDDEINDFYSQIDKDKDGRVSLTELEARLNCVLDELSPKPATYHLNHPDRKYLEQVAVSKDKRNRSDLHDFLFSLLPTECRDGQCESISKDAFVKQIRSWQVPSMDPAGQETKEAREYDGKLSKRRRLRAWWSVKGPELLFLTFVALLTIGMSLWQGLIYVTNPQARSALGAGVIIAKFSAGAIYPLFFFLILSMSRWFATLCRYSYTLSRIVNWDLSQSFHIKMSCLALFFAFLHGLGHLAGTFQYGSRAAQQPALVNYLGGTKSYTDFVSSRPGWSGLVALGSFTLLSITSLPEVRAWSYELFQICHLLMYPIFAMLGLHGTAKLLQAPMLGYWLVFPVILVAAERSLRFVRTFSMHHPAKLEPLDDSTLVVTIDKPEGHKWHAHAGQYIYLQVPQVSRFQWHPFTISRICQNRLQIHIKADGNWTSKLHALAHRLSKDVRNEGQPAVKVGVDGPFGAPAQRWHTFDKSLIIGAGIGVTPFAAILSDLEANFRAQGDPWKLTRKRSFLRSQRTLEREQTLVDDGQLQLREALSDKTSEKDQRANVQSLRRNKPGVYSTRRVDFHWSVRERDQLNWFAELLNRASDLAEGENTNLTLNIQAHVTSKRKDISQHIFRWLIDSYQTPCHPYSALTGLRRPAHFGRPHYERIIAEYYDDMCKQGWTGRVGVFSWWPATDCGDAVRFVQRIYEPESSGRPWHAFPVPQ